MLSSGTHTCTYPYTHIHTCTHIHICTYPLASHTCTHPHTYTHMHMHTHTHMHIPTCTTHIHTHTYTHAPHTQTPTHPHTQTGRPTRGTEGLHSWSKCSLGLAILHFWQAQRVLFDPHSEKHGNTSFKAISNKPANKMHYIEFCLLGSWETNVIIWGWGAITSWHIFQWTACV